MKLRIQFLPALVMLLVSALYPANASAFVPSNDKAYYIQNKRGDLGTKDGFLVNTVRADLGATKGQFALISYQDLLYLYSIADKKFMYRDPVTDANGWSNVILSNERIDAFELEQSTTFADYPVRIKSNGFILNSARQTQKGVCLNTWNKYDEGNHYAFIEAAEFDPAEALATLERYFSGQLTVTYRVEDAQGNLLEELTATGNDGEVITAVPDHVERHAYTTYTVQQPVTLAKGGENIVKVTATWKLPFELSPDLDNVHWYNLALREGTEYVTTDNGYRCNPTPTSSDVMSDTYQWAFQGDPYNGIVVRNRSDLAKTLAKVNDRAVLSSETYAWKIEENSKGFLLANNTDGKYINEYGGSGGYLGFWHNASDINSIFTVSEVGSLTVENVKLPSGATLKLFKSDEENANGRAVLVIPGGGYGYVAGSSEGADWAPLFNELGYTAAVLTYTTPPTAPDGPLTQACDAMRYLREHAEECRTTTGQIGVIGFSAGGHLASTVATHTTGDERPVFQILFYPVITMDASYTHAGSRQNLLGDNPSDELVTLYSNEKQVTEQTPMCYLCWAENDGTVPPLNSKAYAEALRAKDIPVHTKSFPVGGHGFGFKTTYAYHDQMVEDLTQWLRGIDEGLTHIDSPHESSPLPEVCYNLAGQRISKPSHGVYICRGALKVK
ncbi:MAG: alpha/beta hydrolase [Bacteroidales bacterium]|nr:alpha/beta hydrolase [Bacteroidales bacterium]